MERVESYLKEENVEYYSIFSTKGDCLLSGVCNNEVPIKKLTVGNYFLIINYKNGKTISYRLTTERSRAYTLIGLDKNLDS